MQIISSPDSTIVRRIRPGVFRSLALFFVQLACTILASVGGLAPRASAIDEIVLRMRKDPQIQSHSVKLGELVEVVSGQSASLQSALKATLGPAPALGTPQRWNQSQINEHLYLRGIHPNSIRWTGTSEAIATRVPASAAAASQQMMPAFMQDRNRKQAESLVQRAIRQYVEFRTGEQVGWQVLVQLKPEDVPYIRSTRSIVSLAGGKEPWEGEQQFVIRLRVGTTTRDTTVQALLELPPMIVTSTRPLRRDEILTPDTLTYAPMPENRRESDEEFFTDINELVGQQLRRAVSKGLPIISDYVGEPVLVSRNALVQIESVAGSVTVRTQAKSMGSGGRGDLIEVEVLGTKQRLYATVVDPVTVRVAAQSTPVQR